MAFSILIARNNSEAIALSKDITPLFEVNGVLRENSSIIDPVIELEAPIDSLVDANYAIIPTFGRRYFIKNAVSTYNRLSIITCHVDVLSSFADSIKRNTGIVHRQEKRWNLYLNDGVLKCYQNPFTSTIPFPNDLFTGRSNVLLVAGGHGDGASYGTDEGGAGGTTMKNTAGLVDYCTAQLGEPYWYGTFGNTASQALYDSKKAQYGYLGYYNETDYPAQFGRRVHDCVGLVKGYRWSDTPTSDPLANYEPSEDVDVKGLWYQCSVNSGNINYAISTHQIGMIVFNAGLTHCGVYIGNGNVIEARGHAYGVVESNMESRGFEYWGIPDWLQITTGNG